MTVARAVASSSHPTSHDVFQQYFFPLLVIAITFDMILTND